MDFTSSPEEPTSVIQIMDDFHNFKTGGRSSRRSASRLRSSRHSGINSMSLDTSERKTSAEFSREKQIELLTLKAKLAKLEDQLKTDDVERKRSRIEERDILMKERKYMKTDEVNQEMQKQLKYVLEKEEGAREEISDLKKKLDAVNEKYTMEADLWNREKKFFVEKLEEANTSHRKTIKELQDRLDMNELIHYKNRAEHGDMQLGLLQSKISKMSKENVELMSKLVAVEQRCMAAEESLASQDEAVVVAKAMQGQMTKLKELERNNNKLKEENQLLRDSRENAVLLQEKYDHIFEKHREAMEKVEALGILEIENEELKKKISRWDVENPQDGTKKSRSPTELTGMISDLQKSQLSMMEKNVGLQTSVGIKDSALQTLTEKYKELKNQFLETQVKEKENSEKCTRLQKRLIMVATERDGIRRILNTYDTADSSNYSPQLLSRVKGADEHVVTCNAIIDKMEAEIDEKQKELSEHRLLSSKLQFELEELKNDTGRQNQESAENLRLKNQIEKLQKANEEIKEKAYILEARIEQRHLQGDFDPTKVKVLHFSGNPLALSRKMRAKEVENLQNENDRLRSKLLKLQQERPRDDGNESVSILSDPKTDKEVEELKSKLESSELHKKRLIEVFSNKVTTFRESSYQLFGFKHDMIGSDQFQIRSIYAESPEDKFLFQNTPEGQIQMLETDFSKQFPAAISTYLNRGTSIPAFLSSVTLELFSKQTHIQDTTLARISQRIDSLIRNYLQDQK